MNKHLKQLVKLSQFDKEIASVEPQIKGEKELLKEVTKPVNELKNKIDKIYGEIDETKNKRIKNDIHLKELNDRLKKIEEKFANVKTEKEQKALQLEEEVTKEQIRFANDEIIRLDKLAEDKSKDIENLKNDLKNEEEKVKTQEDDINNNIKALEEKIVDLSKKRVELIEDIDKKVLSFYEKIKRWAKESAVVPVIDQACYGCYMKLTNRVYGEFLSSDEITTCPHCGRIIYKEEK